MHLIKVKEIITKNWSLVASLILLLIMISILIIFSLNKNQGNFVYALDDAYIHMSMAKNFFQYGVWGITKYEFTSISSSLLWTTLISLSYFVFGVNMYIPFLLNVIFAFATIVTVYYIFNKFKISQYYILLILVAIMFLTPFPAIIFTGMEHMLQIFLTILFIYFSMEVLFDKNSFFKYLIIISLLLAMTRYESLFLIMPVIFLLLLKKKYLYSVWIILVTSIPLIAYGIISMSKGWYFLPNSLLIKSFLPKSYLANHSIMLFASSIFNHFYNQVIASEMYILIFLGVIFLIISLKKRLNYLSSLLFIFLATAILHLSFANIGWFYRYEAYLIFIGIFVNSLAIYQIILKDTTFNFDKSNLFRCLTFVIILSLIFVPLLDRGQNSFNDTPQATNNIYEQQYQMGLFVEKFYNNKSIALNDLGAVNYFADINCVDVNGLANIKVVNAIKDGSYNEETVSKLMEENNVTLIIIYNSWLKSGIPSRWIRVCDWKISNNVICGDETVSFYVVNAEEKDRLIKNINIFSSEMPKDVEVIRYF